MQEVMQYAILATTRVWNKIYSTSCQLTNLKKNTWNPNSCPPTIITEGVNTANRLLFVTSEPTSQCIGVHTPKYIQTIFNTIFGSVLPTKIEIDPIEMVHCWEESQ